MGVLIPAILKMYNTNMHQLINKRVISNCFSFQSIMKSTSLPGGGINVFAALLHTHLAGKSIMPYTLHQKILSTCTDISLGLGNLGRDNSLKSL